MTLSVAWIPCSNFKCAVTKPKEKMLHTNGGYYCCVECWRATLHQIATIQTRRESATKAD